MIKKIGHIIRGWGMRLGLIPISPAEKKLSDLRLRICDKCLYSEPVGVLRILNGNAKKEHELKCNKCKCPCLEKSLVTDESCPINKW